MSVKEENEITLKIICKKEELVKFLLEKGFKESQSFSLDDYYFIPESLNIENMNVREILSHALIIRNCVRDENKGNKRITYKIKDINENGEILKQKAINCEIYDVYEAKELLRAIGYKEIMNIKENDTVYSNEKVGLEVKDIVGGDILMEIETRQGTEYDTIESLKQFVLNLEMPIEPNEYFAKKAEIELNKILNR